MRPIYPGGFPPASTSGGADEPDAEAGAGPQQRARTGHQRPGHALVGRRVDGGAAPGRFPRSDIRPRAQGQFAPGPTQLQAEQHDFAGYDIGSAGASSRWASGPSALPAMASQSTRMLSADALRFFEMSPEHVPEIDGPLEHVGSEGRPQEGGFVELMHPLAPWGSSSDGSADPALRHPFLGPDAQHLFERMPDLPPGDEAQSRAWQVLVGGALADQRAGIAAPASLWGALISHGEPAPSSGVFPAPSAVALHSLESPFPVSQGLVRPGQSTAMEASEMGGVLHDASSPFYMPPEDMEIDESGFRGHPEEPLHESEHVEPMHSSATWGSGAGGSANALRQQALLSPDAQHLSDQMPGLPQGDEAQSSAWQNLTAGALADQRTGTAASSAPWGAGSSQAGPALSYDRPALPRAGQSQVDTARHDVQPLSRHPFPETEYLEPQASGLPALAKPDKGKDKAAAPDESPSPYSDIQWTLEAGSPPFEFDAGLRLAIQRSRAPHSRPSLHDNPLGEGTSNQNFGREPSPAGSVTAVEPSHADDARSAASEVQHTLSTQERAPMSIQDVVDGHSEGLGSVSKRDLSTQLLLFERRLGDLGMSFKEFLTVEPEGVRLSVVEGLNVPNIGKAALRTAGIVPYIRAPALGSAAVKRGSDGLGETAAGEESGLPGSKEFPSGDPTRRNWKRRPPELYDSSLLRDWGSELKSLRRSTSRAPMSINDVMPEQDVDSLDATQMILRSQLLLLKNRLAEFDVTFEHYSTIESAFKRQDIVEKFKMGSLCKAALRKAGILPAFSIEKPVEPIPESSLDSSGGAVRSGTRVSRQRGRLPYDRPANTGPLNPGPSSRLPQTLALPRAGQSRINSVRRVAEPLSQHSSPYAGDPQPQASGLLASARPDKGKGKAVAAEGTPSPEFDRPWSTGERASDVGSDTDMLEAMRISRRMASGRPPHDNPLGEGTSRQNFERVPSTAGSASRVEPRHEDDVQSAASEEQLSPATQERASMSVQEVVDAHSGGLSSASKRKLLSVMKLLERRLGELGMPFEEFSTVKADVRKSVVEGLEVSRLGEAALRNAGLLPGRRVRGTDSVAEERIADVLGETGEGEESGSRRIEFESVDSSQRHAYLYDSSSLRDWGLKLKSLPKTTSRRAPISIDEVMKAHSVFISEENQKRLWAQSRLLRSRLAEVGMSFASFVAIESAFMRQEIAEQFKLGHACIAALRRAGILPARRIQQSAQPTPEPSFDDPDRRD